MQWVWFFTESKEYLSMKDLAFRFLLKPLILINDNYCLVAVKTYGTSYSMDSCI